jgi:hypothetical protein
MTTSLHLFAISLYRSRCSSSALLTQESHQVEFMTFQDNCCISQQFTTIANAGMARSSNMQMHIQVATRVAIVDDKGVMSTPFGSSTDCDQHRCHL